MLPHNIEIRSRPYSTVTSLHPMYITSMSPYL